MFKSLIIDNFMNYWMQGSRDGFIDFHENDLLSLNNENKLAEVAETAEEIYASIGLFLPIELAWEGILDFIKTGKASPKIKWITPEEIPEDGNW